MSTHAPSRAAPSTAGDNSNGEVTPPADLGVAAVSTGWGYTCAILAPGNVRCWGKNKPDIVIKVPPPTDFDSIVHTYIESALDTCYILAPSGGEEITMTRGQRCVGVYDC